MNSINNWPPPIKFDSWGISNNPDSFKDCPKNHGEIPISPHPGSFGFKRKNHTHEGLDFYAPTNTPVFAIEDGIIVAIEDFTGPKANSPWWLDTQALLVEGNSGVIVYGEIEIEKDLYVGKKVKSQELLGKVIQVLKKDKGRPMSMLHLELHTHGTTKTYAWETEKPESLLDPTPFCLSWANDFSPNNCYNKISTKKY